MPRPQVGYSLLDRRAENGMLQFCAEHSIGVLPFGTVAGGFLSAKYLGLPASKCARARGPNSLGRLGHGCGATIDRQPAQGSRRDVQQEQVREHHRPGAF